jgi:hypothetical protein
VQDESGRWYFSRVHPYRSGDRGIEGVLITFVDIDSACRRTLAHPASPSSSIPHNL